MKNVTKIIYLATVLMFMTGCIHNDIPYPYIQANIIELTAEGQLGSTTIDSTAMTATMAFGEETDISAIKIKSYRITPGASVTDDVLDKAVNLKEPVDVTLRLYQDYTWKLIGRQNIERYFEVEGQIGQSIIDPDTRTVSANIPDTRALDAVRIVKAKLGPTGSTMSPDISTGGTINAGSPVTIDVTAYGRTEQWTVKIEQVKMNVRTLRADAFSCVAWVYGQGESGKPHGAEYRQAGTEVWIQVPEADITTTGGDFTARIAHLSPGTTYEARVFSDGQYGEIVDFTTGTTPQMPESDFGNWWLDGKVWCPWPQDGEPFWSTGNKGATTLGQSNTIPSTDTPDGMGYAACLETRFVGIGPLGKLAAGNIFTGSYIRTVGTNGVLSFGRPWEERPVRLRGKYKYTGATIDYSSTEMKHLIGRPDTCIVWAALIDSEEPFEIRTQPSDRQLFDPNGDYVVAYGKFQTAETVDHYIDFDIEIKYKSTSRRPRYLIVTASASKYGDYFTGGAGSTLYLDNFELIYDY